MSKQTVLDKINIVVSELQLSGNTKEAEWLDKVKTDLITKQGKDLPTELKKRLSELNQKSVAPRGYVDTLGQLDMAVWANLLSELAVDIRKSYGVK